MKFMDRLTRFLGRRAEAQIESENDHLGYTKALDIGDGHEEPRSDFATSSLLPTLDANEEAPLYRSVRGGDTLMRDHPNLGGQNLGEQIPKDLAVVENHILVTNNLLSSGKPHREVTTEEVTAEMLKFRIRWGGAHKADRDGLQTDFQGSSTEKDLEAVYGNAANESLGGENIVNEPNHPMVRTADHPPVTIVRITCSSCTACYEVQRSLIPKSGRDMQCSECDHVWFQTLESKDDLSPLWTGHTGQFEKVDPVSSVNCRSSADHGISKREHDGQSLLTPSEIRLIIEAQHEGMHAFIASQRLHATDPKGDTPLHLAARVGNLALCDLFIRSGADPNALNFGRQTSADVALAEGHSLVSQLLSSLVTNSPKVEKIEGSNVAPRTEVTITSIDAVPADRFASSPKPKPEEILKKVRERFEGTYWTVERDEELKRLWSLGTEPIDIAKNLGGLLTSGAILNQIHHLGIYNLKGTTNQRSGPKPSEVSPKTNAKPARSNELVVPLKSTWAEGQSTSKIVKGLDGVSRNAVLSKLDRIGLSNQPRTGTERKKVDAVDTMSEVVSPDLGGADQRSSSKAAYPTATPNELVEIDDFISFQAEEEPEEFFSRTESNTASGTFVALANPAPAISDDVDRDWDLDLSPAPIAGEGIGAFAAITADHGADHDFLKVRNRGRQSVKRAVVQSGTRLSINPEICLTWAEKILAKGWCSFCDIENLVTNCDGNADMEQLRINLQRNLEVAGFDLVDSNVEYDAGLWEARSAISHDDLAEVIDATLTRATRLPGTQRFVMDKSDELQLLRPMVRAKQELQLGILACEAAVEAILCVLDNIRDGSRDPSAISLRSIIPARPSHGETAEVFGAAESLKSWLTNGRAMTGKQRREALAALEALDFSMSFHKELVRSLEQDQANLEHASRLDALISSFEEAVEHLIQQHLPYARRFAARNVEEGEDPEDVFQVVFMGLQRATRRFDPERGYRFVVYASYWMRQTIMRWRADEGSAIRIPIHQKEKIARLDLAMDKLDVRTLGTVSDNDLALDLAWTTDEVSKFRAIPRVAEYPESIDDWDDLLPKHEDANDFDQSENERIVMDALAELPEREADIIRMRFGIGRDADMTLEEIGQLYGVTRERIRQIEAKGLKRLSHPGRKRRLQELLGM